MRMRRERGFTLVETLISLFLISLILSVTVGIMTAAGDRMQRAARHTLDTNLGVAVALLRADLTSASAASVDAAGDLTLFGHPAGTVTYTVAEEQLLRATGGASRVIAIDVAEWSCSVVAGEEDRLLVDLALGVLRTRLDDGPRVQDGVRVRDRQEVDRRVLRIMLRGGGGEGGWW